MPVLVFNAEGCVRVVLLSDLLTKSRDIVLGLVSPPPQQSRRPVSTACTVACDNESRPRGDLIFFLSLSGGGQREVGRDDRTSCAAARLHLTDRSETLVCSYSP